MPLNFFDTKKGFQIDSGVALISASGAPGLAGDSQTVIIGSLYLDIADGDLYTKIASGSGANAWQLFKAKKQFTQLTVSAVVTTVDSVLVDEVSSVRWLIHIEGASTINANDKHVIEVLATHDGDIHGSANDATTTDFNEFGKLKIGNINFDLDVSLSSAGASQVMQLDIVSSTIAINVRALRDDITF